MPGYRITKEAFKNQQLYKKYSCLSCSSLLRDAVQSALCGHWFCESCISLLLNTRNPKCPSCSEDLKPDEDVEESPGYFPDKFVRRDINALEMVCVYSDKGCDWEGTFAKLEGHLAGCQYSVCGTCQQKLTTVPSEHKCLLRAFSCPLTKIGCTAGKFGSKEKFKHHMKDSDISHIELLAASITNMGVEGRSQRGMVKKETDGGFLDSGYGSIDESDGIAKFAEAQLPYGTPTQEVDRAKILSALGITGLKKEIEALHTGLKIKDEELTSLREKITKLEKNQHSKNAGFKDRNFRLSLIENCKHDGTMVWKIPQFSRRNIDALGGKYPSIFSLPFYTGRYGYKMCLRLYIMGDGIGKGNYMSLFFVLMKGEFDNILPWPFIQKVTFKLLNQGNGRDIVDTFQPDPMSTSFRKPRNNMNVASGCPRFVSHEDLKSGSFIVDDTVFIKCVVDTTTIRHP